MILLLHSRYLGPEYTISELYIDGVYLCDTIEDRVRDLNNDGDLQDKGEKKVYGKTAIPGKIYEVQLTWSPHFKRELPLLLDVPGFKYIRIHAGNTAEDSEGCILPGENKVKGMVINSRKYEKIIVEKMRLEIANGGSIAIEIRR